MEFKREFPYNCVLNWRRGKKTIPNQPSTNVPVFYTASSSLCYRAFAATFKAMEASFFRREQRTITVSPTEILMSSRMCNHLASPELRELQVLSLLYQLVQVNVGEFARCHEEWRNLLLKVSTIWHTSTLSKRLMNTSSMTRTLNFKSGCKTLSRSMQK